MWSKVFVALLQVGAKVLKKDFLRKKRKGGKMDPQWLGTYVIATDLDKGFYELSDLNTGEIVTKRINAAHLKPYITLPAPDADTSLESVEVFSPNIVFVVNSANFKLLIYTLRIQQMIQMVQWMTA